MSLYRHQSSSCFEVTHLKSKKDWTDCYIGAHWGDNQHILQIISCLHFQGYYIFKYSCSCSHCIQSLAHIIGWRSTCIRSICKNWKNSFSSSVDHWGAERHKATFSDQQKRKKSSFSFYKCFLYMCFFNYSMCQILYAMWILRKVFKDIITTEADSGRPKILFHVFDVCNVLYCANWLNLSKYATSK
jgi:hypothetical protein